jgi:tetratricopeptide (TPR) repeat protein
MIVWLFVGMLIGAAMGMMEIPFWPVLTAIFAFGFLVGSYRATMVSQAFRLCQYNKVAALLSPAIRWNAVWIPVTYFQVTRCAQIHIDLLLAEGRFNELEAVTRYMWGYAEPNGAPDDPPKNWVISNNLAVAYMCQGRYAESAEVLRNILPSVKDNKARIYVLNNLALCETKYGSVQEAEAHLLEAIGLIPRNEQSLITSRTNFVRASIELLKGKLDSAERYLEDAQRIESKLDDSPQFNGQCFAVLAEIRQKQGRLDEAELHFKSAIDLLEVGANTPYFLLASVLNEYAELLEEMGRTPEAAEKMQRAIAMNAKNTERELEALNGLRGRLAQKRIGSASELTHPTPKAVKLLNSKSVGAEP